LAAAVIAGLALPWMERSSAPYSAGLNHLGDVTRDPAHAPKIAQFRIEMRGDVLWPADVSEVDKAANDNSLVMRIQDGEESFLLPRDIEKKVENELVDEHAPLAANFLKVPHHGSKTSSTDAFVGAVGPRVAVVSVGEANQFGHPVDSVVERYAHAGVRFLRTDRDGAVTAVTDGQDLVVHTFVEKRLQ
jgi:beta-lactamase superfamily II metal-dependent hydrolase